MLCLVSCVGPAHQRQARAHPTPSPPTGIYACDFVVCQVPPFDESNMLPAFILRLETNGTYSAQESIYELSDIADEIGCWHRPYQQGTWKWNDQSREFMLTPTWDGTFHFLLGRLPVDKHNHERLRWGSDFLVLQK